MAQPKASPVNSKALIALSQKNKTFAQAMKLIIKLYKGQARPYTGLRYDSHPLTVGSLLLDRGLDEATVLVAILADVLHASSLKEATLRDLFGDAVADRVVALTPEPNHAAYLARLMDLDGDTQSIKIASLLDEVCAIPERNQAEAAQYKAFAALAHRHLELADTDLRDRLGMALAHAEVVYTADAVSTKKAKKPSLMSRLNRVVAGV